MAHLRVRALWGSLVLLVTLFGYARADTWSVRQDGTGDFDLISTAVDSASSGDVIIVGPGSWTELVNTGKDLNFSSSDGPDVTTFDGENSHRSFMLDGPGHFVFEGFSFENGYGNDDGGSVIVRDGATALFSGCRFSNNYSPHDGGALFVRSDSHLEVEDSSFVDNSAFHNSGGVNAVLNSELILHGCQFIGNSSQVISGAVACNDGHMEITGCLFRDNVSGDGSGFGAPGAIHYYQSTGIVSGNTFYGNISFLKGTILINYSPQTQVDLNIIANDRTGVGLDYQGGVGEHSCNIFWGNDDGSIYGGALSSSELEVDPQFCDPPHGDFTVGGDSPAVPSNNSCAEQIGAFGPGCETPKPELIMSADSAGGTYGEEVATTVSLRLTDPSAPIVSSIGGLDLVLRWNPVVATFVRVESTEKTANWQIASDDTHAPYGELHVSMAGLDGFDVGPEKVPALRVVFQFVSDGGYTTLDLTQTKVFTTEPAPVSHSTEAGTLTEGCVKGDVHADGSIDSADAIVALKIAVGLIQPTPAQLCAADMNDDGKVDVGDAVLILQAAVASPKTESTKTSAVASTVELSPSSDGATLNLSGIAGLDAELAYDPTKLHFVAGGSQNGLVVVNDAQQGLVHLAFAASSEDDAVVDLHFESSNGGGLLTLQQLWGCDLGGQSVGLSNDEQSVFVSSTATSAPSSSRRAQLLGIYPNPFNPQTEIKFRLDGQQSDLSIYDSAGHLVRSFDLSHLGSGEHSIRWSGRDDGGRTVASGVYYVRLQTARGPQVLRAVLLK